MSSSALSSASADRRQLPDGTFKSPPAMMNFTFVVAGAFVFGRSELIRGSRNADRGARLGVACAVVVAFGATSRAGADVTIEGESMAILERTALVDRQPWPATGNGAQLWWHGNIRVNDKLVLGFNVKTAGRYRISATLLRAPDYGIVKIDVDGAGNDQAIDLFAEQVVVDGPEIELGTFDLSAGVHRLSVTMVGAKNRALTQSMFGLDALRLKAAAPSDAISPAVISVNGADSVTAGAGELVSARRFVRVYDPSADELKSWYINDHTFIRDDAGTWHLIGITHAEPADPLDEKHFAHATAPSLLGPWTKQPFALAADSQRGESVLWAPHILRHDRAYYIFYCAGDADHTKFKLHVATSADLDNWTRSDANPIVVDGFDARDPMVLRVGDEWVLYYTANSTPAGGDHVVFAVTSKDLIHWGEKRTVFTAPRKGREGGPTESPFVVRRGDAYYLFCGAWEGYLGTYAFKSADPFHFDYVNRIGRIDSHASEIVRDEAGHWYASHAGWGQGGVHLARLTWHDDLDERETSMPSAGKEAVR
jgi:hypothetical protein